MVFTHPPSLPARLRQALAHVVSARPLPTLAAATKASATAPLIAFETLRPAGVDAARLSRPRARGLRAERRRLSLRAHDRGGRRVRAAAALSKAQHELDAHPLLELSRRPNRGAVRPRPARGLVRASCSSPATPISRRSRIGGALRELHALRPDRMKVVPGADGWPEAYEYTVAGRPCASPARTAPGCAHPASALFHPLNDHYGMRRSRRRPSAIDIHNAARALEQGAARQRGAALRRARLSPPRDGNLTDEQFERLKARARAELPGRRQRRPAAAARRRARLEGDVAFAEGHGFHRGASTPRRARSRSPSACRRCCSAFPATTPMPITQEANRAFWRQTVLPLVDRTAQGDVAAGSAPAFGARRSSCAPTSTPSRRCPPSARRCGRASTRRPSSPPTRSAPPIGYGPLDEGDETARDE